MLSDDPASPLIIGAGRLGLTAGLFLARHGILRVMRKRGLPIHRVQFLRQPIFRTAARLGHGPELS